jgi:murein DD-endopeptidase MepM/ murein hydrolase activator NlpD
MSRTLCVIVLLGILVAACQSDLESSTGGGGVVSTPSQSGVEAVQRPVTSGLTVHKGSTIRTPVEALLLSKPTALPKPTDAPVAQATNPPFVICSPLTDTPVNQLVTIISDPYRSPPPGSEARHHGVDFAYFRKFGRVSIEGAGVQAIFTGQVAAAIVDSFPYGNLIIIETPGVNLPVELAGRVQIAQGESLYVLFAHLERPPAVRLGDSVEACQSLGTAGKSGNAGGAHLHVEARLGPSGARFTSMAYYKVWATEEQRANYLLWRTSGTFRHFDPMSLLIY